LFRQSADKSEPSLHRQGLLDPFISGDETFRDSYKMLDRLSLKRRFPYSRYIGNLVEKRRPSLTASGVQGALPATTLELHDANGAVINNEGWRNTQEADIIATTIPPGNDNEAAILATLVPGITPRSFVGRTIR
jgi:hypothetical protein